MNLILIAKGILLLVTNNEKNQYQMYDLNIPTGSHIELDLQYSEVKQCSECHCKIDNEYETCDECLNGLINELNIN